MRDIPQPIPEHEIETKKVTLQDESGREYDDYSGNEEEKVRAWTGAALEEIYMQGYSSGRNGEDQGFLPFSEDVKHVVNYLAEKNPQNGLRIFFEELIDFAASKSRLGDQKKLREFLAVLGEVTFAGTPNIADHLNMAEQLIVTAKANRVPEVQGYFGQSMTSGLAYDLAWSGKKAVTPLVDRMRNLDLPDLLDVADQLQRLRFFPI